MQLCSLQICISCLRDKPLLLSTAGFFPYCPISFQETCQSIRSLKPLPLPTSGTALGSKATRQVMGKSQPFRASPWVKAPRLFKNCFSSIYRHLTFKSVLVWTVLRRPCMLCSEKKFPHLYFYWKTDTLWNVRIIRTFTNGNEFSLLFCLPLYWNVHIHMFWLILRNYTEILVQASRISLT